MEQLNHRQMKPRMFDPGASNLAHSQMVAVAMILVF